MPKISVIIPNYNHAPYLDKRIQSVINQTYQDFEIIILDDNSTDHSREVIALYRSHPKVKYIFLNQINSGSTFKQWNKGVKAASGDYIWIAESDDYADKHFLEILASKLDEFPTAGIAYCQSWIIDENDTILNSGLKWYQKSRNKERWQHDFFNQGIDECRHYLSVHNSIFNASAVLFRKSIYIKAGFADESYRFVGDWMQWMKMLSISDVVYLSEHLNFFRKHHTTTRHSSYLNFKELIEYYKLLNFVSGQMNIDLKNVENFFLNSRWQLASKNRLTKDSLVNLFKVYQVGKNVDPFIIKRILRYFKVRLKQNNLLLM